jgi:hypothetical protein
MDKTKTTYYVFDANIRYETDPAGVNEVQALIDFVNETEGKLKIGFCSRGGHAGLARFIANILNDNKDRIEIVAYSHVESSGFEILYMFEGKKTITQGTRGMIHYGYMEADVDDRGRLKTDYERQVVEGRKSDFDWRNNMAKDVLTPAQLKRFKKGQDVVINYEQMKSIFEG